MTLTQLPQITALLNSVFERERIVAASLSQQEAELRQQLQDIAKSRSEPRAWREPSDDPALTAGADLQWQMWIEQRIADINRELAQVLALKLDQSDRLRIAFGRHQAAIGIQKRSDAKREQIMKRRSNYMS